MEWRGREDAHAMQQQNRTSHLASKGIILASFHKMCRTTRIDAQGAVVQIDKAWNSCTCESYAESLTPL